MYPYKGEAKRYYTRTHTRTLTRALTREGNVKTEAAFSVMQLQTKECQQLPEAGKGKELIARRASGEVWGLPEGRWACCTLISSQCYQC